MREIELTPKANEDPENIWLYGFETFGMEKADCYILHISSTFGHLAQHSAGRRREELGQIHYYLTPPFINSEFRPSAGLSLFPHPPFGNYPLLI
ncbi:hypothetical protein TUM17576_30630 [Enterobacter hormaechei]|uniref:Type II toxin-antitoxin system RelE/ParE family toxin n=1 Tax=Phytobacter ursingii TaxID=1972431 RepID=A0AB35RSZ8_9ENTR|nr:MULTISPECIES: type II toxin-antitoxin system RelE/ParE family toxin [Enterobacteriaceae]MDV2865261.1 type II toxin-antitoxin system RelE/ParE family toxin [Phytobacter ursingii]GJL36243.1 hypothetical protein TUM17576_30630 [Enterobacter hormaechei]